MAEPFVPHKIEEEVIVRITKKEAILVQKLRKYPYGEVTVTKANGLIIYIVAKDRQKIEDDEIIGADMLS